MSSTTKYKLFHKSARVWVRDPESVWTPALVEEDFDGSQLRLISEGNSETFTIAVKNPDVDLPPLRNPEILIGVNDLTSLSYLHEPAVLHNLSVRFIQQEAIYTYCGIVLVAINPYCELHIYGNDTISMYRGKSMGDLDPHVYAVAEEAFTKMERDSKNQSIIVSGESGAGKTVSAKYAMRYFATVGGTSQTETQVEKKVLASSPIMEAIGNAKTTRNDNSSRFGKYIEIDFSQQLHIIAADMRTYLLEKSRVVFQAPHERNYHIFYQMCAARNSESLSGLGLAHPDEFNYLNQGESPEISGVDDKKEFHYTQDALKMLNLSTQDQHYIFRILSGILQLGNVEILPMGRLNSESSNIPERNVSIGIMADLFQVSEPDIRKWLLNRKIVTSRESYVKPMDQASALFARDALAKTIYSRLFDWIVNQINKSLRCSSKIYKFIGVLDIYGFETFATNSFEQFCINYANEKLQQQFNMHVFKLEQDEYLKEGIEWKMIDFYDNQPCIDLIESKLGILDLLDEECRMPKGSDKSWIDKLYDKCSKWSHFSKNRLSNSSFIVKHFADNVEYESHGFLDKNRDTVLEEQVNILKESKNKVLSAIFANYEDPNKKQVSATGTLKKQSKRTVGSQFRDSLNLLMEALNSTTPHYIRCIKPNDTKTAFHFESKRAIQQLRACGVLETVRISAAGYPSRWSYHDFFIRYRVLCQSKKDSDLKGVCEGIVKRLIEDEDKYQFGKNKIFFRAGQVAYMEKLRSTRLMECGIMIQKHVKGWLCRKRFLKIASAARLINRVIRGFLARRKVRSIKRNKAAIILQASFKGWRQRSKYLKLLKSVIFIQSRLKGYLGRKKYSEFRRGKNAIVIQKNVRSYIQRKKYRKLLRSIIVVQSCVRRFIAKKRLKKLKIEAKSVEHQKKLNQGLENKIISLQQKLTTSLQEKKELSSLKSDYDKKLLEIKEFNKKEVEFKASKTLIENLKNEISKLKEELNLERGEKVDIINEKVKESENWALIEAELRDKISHLTSELSSITDDNQEKLESKSLEHSQQLKAEKNVLSLELEQERISYQKLLKEYNELESRLEKLQEDSKGSNSMMETEEDSLYGSQSGKSSIISSGIRNRAEEWDGVSVDGFEQSPNLSLTLKLQRKLDEALRDRDRMAHKVEELEARVNSSYDHTRETTNDHLRVQELEIENSKVRGSLKKMRETILKNSGHNVELKEILDQYDSLEEEVVRLREECVSLRGILSNCSVDQPLSLMSKSSDVPEGDELFSAYEAQRVVIKQLQDKLSELSINFKEVETELKSELEKTMNTVAQQQQIINETINVEPANKTEACLQHEITRLTGENFDLREKIEVLFNTTKQLKRQVKMYIKKLDEAGVSVSEISVLQDESVETFPAQTLPAVIKKEHEYMGMFQYKVEKEASILKALIYDLKPRVASQMLPGLPAYIIFMMIRYTDYINNDAYVRSLIQKAISLIKKVIRKTGKKDLEVQTLWFANILRLLHNLQQYSGDKAFQNEITPKQVEQSLRNFDLSQYRRIISDVAVWIYQNMTTLIEEEIQSLIVPAVLEHEAFNAGNRPNKTQETNGGTPGHVDPKEALDKLLKLMTRFLHILEKYGLDPDIISQLFKQILYFICANSLNNLLLRKDMCNWSKGMTIRYNIAQIEQWARDEKIHDDKNQVISSLSPIIQASQLLQAKKDDVKAICDMCDKLKESQIVKILNLYTPADEYEERVSTVLVREIQAVLKDRPKKDSDLVDQKDTKVTLLMDTKFSFAVRFTFCPSTIQLEELEIPACYAGLQHLKKI